MIKHIVIFKLNPPYTPEEKANSLKKLQDIFSPLAHKLGYIIDYRTEFNISTTDNAGDFVIDSVFASLDDLKRYQSCREHQDAIAEASEIRKTKTVADYEF
jgi:hypothetical protein